MADLAAVIPKEPVPHLEHMFFGLSKIPDRSNGCVCRYENDRGEYLEMEGSPRCGLPTIFDGDFTIYAASVIVAERRREHGVIRFSAVDSAEFSRLSPVRKPGGKLYQGIKKGLTPLSRANLTTNISAVSCAATRIFGMANKSPVVRARNLTSPDRPVGCSVARLPWPRGSGRRSKRITP